MSLGEVDLATEFVASLPYSFLFLKEMRVFVMVFCCGCSCPPRLHRILGDGSAVTSELSEGGLQLMLSSTPPRGKKLSLPRNALSARSTGQALTAVRRRRAGAAPAVRVARVVGVLAAVADAVVGVASAEQQVPPPCGKKCCHSATERCVRSETASSETSATQSNGSNPTNIASNMNLSITNEQCVTSISRGKRKSKEIGSTEVLWSRGKGSAIQDQLSCGGLEHNELTPREA